MTKLKFSQLPSNPVSFGLVCSFVANYPPFDAYEFGLMVKTLRFQLEMQSHMIGSLDNQIAAYVGWIETSREIAEAWSASQGPLHAAQGDSIAVTVFATRSSSYILPMIKEAKKHNLGKSVFWKRDFVNRRGSVKRAVRKRIT